MPEINKEFRQMVVKNAISIITLTAEEVTEIVTNHLIQSGYGIISKTVVPRTDYKYQGNPNWGIPESPVGLFLGYRAEIEMTVADGKDDTHA